MAGRGALLCPWEGSGQCANLVEWGSVQRLAWGAVVGSKVDEMTTGLLLSRSNPGRLVQQWFVRCSVLVGLRGQIGRSLVFWRSVRSFGAPGATVLDVDDVGTIHQAIDQRYGE